MSKPMVDNFGMVDILPRLSPLYATGLYPEMETALSFWIDYLMLVMISGELPGSSESRLTTTSLPMTNGTLVTKMILVVPLATLNETSVTVLSQAMLSLSSSIQVEIITQTSSSNMSSTEIGTLLTTTCTTRPLSE